MNTSKALSITLAIIFWAAIFMFFLPRACSKELANQDAANARYASSSITSMSFSGSTSLTPSFRGLS